MNAHNYAVAATRFLAELMGLMPVQPEIDRRAIAALAGCEDAKERAATSAGHGFDAVNNTAAFSEAVETHHRELAAAEGGRARKVWKALRKQPEVISTVTRETAAKPAGWNLFTGFIAVIFLAALMTPIPIIVAQGIAQSYVFDSISDDWTQAVPFGFVVLAGIFASGLMRMTLSHRGKDIHDFVVSALGVIALAGWIGAYGMTFLAPASDDAGFGVAEADLRAFYIAVVASELCIGIGLFAMAERAFMAGRKTVHTINKAVAILTARYDAIRERQLFHINCADACVAARARYAAARAAFVEANLIALEEARLRRAAAMARAAAFFDPSTTDDHQ